MKRITTPFNFALLALLLVAVFASGCKEKTEAQKLEEKAKISAEKARAAVKDAANKAGEAIKETAEKTWDATKDQTQKVASEVSEGIKQGSQQAVKLATNAAGVVKQETLRIRDKANTTRE